MDEKSQSADIFKKLKASEKAADKSLLDKTEAYNNAKDDVKRLDKEAYETQDESIRMAALARIQEIIKPHNLGPWWDAEKKKIVEKRKLAEAERKRAEDEAAEKLKAEESEKRKAEAEAERIKMEVETQRLGEKKKEERKPSDVSQLPTPRVHPALTPVTRPKPPAPATVIPVKQPVHPLATSLDSTDKGKSRNATPNRRGGSDNAVNREAEESLLLSDDDSRHSSARTSPLKSPRSLTGSDQDLLAPATPSRSGSGSAIISPSATPSKRSVRRDRSKYVADQQKKEMPKAQRRLDISRVGLLEKSSVATPFDSSTFASDQLSTPESNVTITESDALLIPFPSPSTIAPPNAVDSKERPAEAGNKEAIAPPKKNPYATLDRVLNEWTDVEREFQKVMSDFLKPPGLLVKIPENINKNYGAIIDRVNQSKREEEDLEDRDDFNDYSKFPELKTAEDIKEFEEYKIPLILSRLETKSIIIKIAKQPARLRGKWITHLLPDKQNLVAKFVSLSESQKEEYIELSKLNEDEIVAKLAAMSAEKKDLFSELLPLSNWNLIEVYLTPEQRHRFKTFIGFYRSMIGPRVLPEDIFDTSEKSPPEDSPSQLTMQRISHLYHVICERPGPIEAIMKGAAKAAVFSRTQKITDLNVEITETLNAVDKSAEEESYLLPFFKRVKAIFYDLGFNNYLTEKRALSNPSGYLTATLSRPWQLGPRLELLSKEAWSSAPKTNLKLTRKMKVPRGDVVEEITQNVTNKDGKEITVKEALYEIWARLKEYAGKVNLLSKAHNFDHLPENAINGIIDDFFKAKPVIRGLNQENLIAISRVLAFVNCYKHTDSGALITSHLKSAGLAEGTDRLINWDELREKIKRERDEYGVHIEKIQRFVEKWYVSHRRSLFSGNHALDDLIVLINTIIRETAPDSVLHSSLKSLLPLLNPPSPANINNGPSVSSVPGLIQASASPAAVGGNITPRTADIGNGTPRTIASGNGTPRIAANGNVTPRNTPRIAPNDQAHATRYALPMQLYEPFNMFNEGDLSNAEREIRRNRLIKDKGAVLKESIRVELKKERVELSKATKEKEPTNSAQKTIEEDKKLGEWVEQEFQRKIDELITVENCHHFIRISIIDHLLREFKDYDFKVANKLFKAPIDSTQLINYRIIMKLAMLKKLSREELTRKCENSSFRTLLIDAISSEIVTAGKIPDFVLNGPYKTTITNVYDILNNMVLETQLAKTPGELFVPNPLSKTKSANSSSDWWLAFLANTLMLRDYYTKTLSMGEKVAEAAFAKQHDHHHWKKQIDEVAKCAEAIFLRECSDEFDLLLLTLPESEVISSESIRKVQEKLQGISCDNGYMPILIKQGGKYFICGFSNGVHNDGAFKLAELNPAVLPTEPPLVFPDAIATFEQAHKSTHKKIDKNPAYRSLYEYIALRAIHMSDEKKARNNKDLEELVAKMVESYKEIAGHPYLKGSKLKNELAYWIKDIAPKYGVSLSNPGIEIVCDKTQRFYNADDMFDFSITPDKARNAVNKHFIEKAASIFHEYLEKVNHRKHEQTMLMKIDIVNNILNDLSAIHDADLVDLQSRMQLLPKRYQHIDGLIRDIISNWILNNPIFDNGDAAKMIADLGDYCHPLPIPEDEELDTFECTVARWRHRRSSDYGTSPIVTENITESGDIRRRGRLNFSSNLPRQYESPLLHPQYWYSAEDINKILKILLIDGVDAHIFSPQLPIIQNDFNDEFCTTVFKSAVEKTLQTNIPSVLAIDLTEEIELTEKGVPKDAKTVGNHWIGVVIARNKDQNKADTVTIKIIDSQGNELPNKDDGTPHDVTVSTQPFDFTTLLQRFTLDRNEDGIRKWNRIIKFCKKLGTYKLNDNRSVLAATAEITVTGEKTQRKDNGSECGPCVVDNIVAEIKPIAAKKASHTTPRQAHSQCVKLFDDNKGPLRPQDYSADSASAHALSPEAVTSAPSQQPVPQLSEDADGQQTPLPLTVSPTVAAIASVQAADAAHSPDSQESQASISLEPIAIASPVLASLDALQEPHHSLRKISLDVNARSSKGFPEDPTEDRAYVTIPLDDQTNPDPLSFYIARILAISDCNFKTKLGIEVELKELKKSLQKELRLAIRAQFNEVSLDEESMQKIIAATVINTLNLKLDTRQIIIKLQKELGGKLGTQGDVQLHRRLVKLLKIIEPKVQQACDTVTQMNSKTSYDKHADELARFATEKYIEIEECKGKLNRELQRQLRKLADKNKRQQLTDDFQKRLKERQRDLLETLKNKISDTEAKMNKWKITKLGFNGPTPYTLCLKDVKESIANVIKDTTECEKEYKKEYGKSFEKAFEKELQRLADSQTDEKELPRLAEQHADEKELPRQPENQTKKLSRLQQLAQYTINAFTGSSTVAKNYVERHLLEQVITRSVRFESGFTGIISSFFKLIIQRQASVETCKELSRLSDQVTYQQRADEIKALGNRLDKPATIRDLAINVLAKPITCGGKLVECFKTGFFAIGLNSACHYLESFLPKEKRLRNLDRILVPNQIDRYTDESKIYPLENCGTNKKLAILNGMARLAAFYRRDALGIQLANKAGITPNKLNARWSAQADELAETAARLYMDPRSDDVVIAEAVKEMEKTILHIKNSSYKKSKFRGELEALCNYFGNKTYEAKRRIDALGEIINYEIDRKNAEDFLQMSILQAASNGISGYTNLVNERQFITTLGPKIIEAKRAGATINELFQMSLERRKVPFLRYQGKEELAELMDIYLDEREENTPNPVVLQTLKEKINKLERELVEQEEEKLQREAEELARAEKLAQAERKLAEYQTQSMQASDPVTSARENRNSISKKPLMEDIATPVKNGEAITPMAASKTSHAGVKKRLYRKSNFCDFTKSEMASRSAYNFWNSEEITQQGKLGDALKGTANYLARIAPKTSIAHNVHAFFAEADSRGHKLGTPSCRAESLLAGVSATQENVRRDMAMV